MIRYTLGIETSCDETAVAVYHAERGLVAHQVYSQAVHQPYGGVVPELAARDHVAKLLPLLHQTLSMADLSIDMIDGIAYTQGPGLIGALLVGSSLACGLAFALDLPIVGVHHLEAHILAAMLQAPCPEFPFLALIVSGGHTLLVAAHALGRYEVLGESVDDAAGEAFDKTAKLMGLGYPGGAALAALAESGDAKRFNLPRPMLKQPGLNFSFSGLKTHVAALIKTHSLDMQTRADIASGFQQAVVETLYVKCQRAIEQTQLNQLVLVGGVAANQKLRDYFTHRFAKKGVQIFYPPGVFCTDNAAMVAYAGHCAFAAGNYQSSVLAIDVKPRWPLSDYVSGISRRALPR